LFQLCGGIGDCKGADRASRPLQRMRQCTYVFRQGGDCIDQMGRLRGKHREHLAFQTGVAECHATEMRKIDRTVIGSERRR
jgi:hypothetical protein